MYMSKISGIMFPYNVPSEILIIRGTLTLILPHFSPHDSELVCNQLRKYLKFLDKGIFFCIFFKKSVSSSFLKDAECLFNIYNP